MQPDKEVAYDSATALVSSVAKQPALSRTEYPRSECPRSAGGVLLHRGGWPSALLALHIGPAWSTIGPAVTGAQKGIVL